MKRVSPEAGRITGSTIIGLCLLLIIGLGIWLYISGRSGPLLATLRMVKDTSQDAATTSKVKTAFLLSKHVSPFEIKVRTDRSEVFLSGNVPTDETRRLAVAIARDTPGVRAVQDEISVNPAMGRNPDAENIGDRVADLEIKTLVTDQLAQEPSLKDKRFTVQVTKRRVALDGTVDSLAQRRTAERIVLEVPGVLDLASNIVVANAPPGTDGPEERLARRVEFELYSTRAIGLKDVQVRAQGETVVLAGRVSSRAERLLAEKVGQSVDGVKRVVNNLAVSDEPAPATR